MQLIEREWIDPLRNKPSVSCNTQGEIFFYSGKSTAITRVFSRSLFILLVYNTLSQRNVYVQSEERNKVFACARSSRTSHRACNWSCPSACTSRYLSCLFSLADESAFPSRVSRVSHGNAEARSNTLTLSFLLCRTRTQGRISGFFVGHVAATNVPPVRTNVQNEAQPEDTHEVRVRRPEKLQVSRMPVKVYAKHQSTSSSSATTQHLSATEVLGT